ncbi:MAG TPA: biosynthetic-type acetolactate synthase large subunit [Candidatus Deferrimicrobium sp.]|nr:biosynthetic-type acetolactate synthase large subunit [Candidatus Deferrimicrobium sp.]
MKITGADVLLKSLELEGVDVVFGYPGATVISIYDALLNSKIKHYMVRHEQGAAHAADGYARSTGKVGVCLSTSGPGATNLVTGIATSYMDSTPLVAITGQVGTTALGLDSFQEADITGITLPVTKHSYLVKKVEDVARVVREAFYLARSGRPGPVLIDITKDALDAMTEFNPPEKVQLRSYKVFSKGNGGKIAEATAALSKAKKPLICVGGGVITAGASPELLDLLQKTDIPVVSTLMGLGSVSAKEKAWLGMLGMHGTPTANYAVNDCDVLLAVGVRFSDRVAGQGKKFAPNATVIHVDIDPAEIGKVIRVAIPIVGDAKSVLGELVQRVTPPEIDEWLEKISLWRKEYPLRYEKNGQLKPQYVIQQLCEVLGDRGIVTTEVGQNQMWTAQHFAVKKPRTLITSGGLGTMGFGLPAAVGVQIGNPDKVVVDIAGDGSIQMNIQELSTVKQYQLPVKVVILNNSSLGLVKQWQALFFEERYSGVHLEASPDFVKLAEAYGIKGYRITDSSQVRATLEEAIAYPGPVIMDFVIPPDEKVLPMVPPGKGLTEMLGR